MYVSHNFCFGLAAPSEFMCVRFDATATWIIMSTIQRPRSKLKHFHRVVRTFPKCYLIPTIILSHRITINTLPPRSFARPLSLTHYRMRRRALWDPQAGCKVTGSFVLDVNVLITARA